MPQKGRSMPARFLTAIVLSMIAAPVIMTATPYHEQHPNNRRGESHRMYSFDATPDKINLFNGVLSTKIDLGLRYPASGLRHYQFAAHYTSAIWDRRASGDALALSAMQMANAGLGWYVGFGELLPPQSPQNPTGAWFFVDPDGAPHQFFAAGRPGATENDPAGSVWYTWDGSYLRLRIVAAERMEVDSSDGSTRVYTCTNGNCKLGAIRDVFGDLLTVTETTPGIRVYSDPHRTHRVIFKPDPSGRYLQLVDRIELAAAGGLVATYVFEYTVRNVNVPAAGGTGGQQIQAPLLVRIRQPDGTAYTMGYTASGPGDRDGLLTAMTLPTLAQISWAYSGYTFAPAGCTDLPAPLRWQVGVASRSVRSALGVNQGTWSFASVVKGNTTSPPACTDGLTREVQVTTPRGDGHVYYFNVTASPTSWMSTRYAFPVSFTRSEVVVGPSGVQRTAYLSRTDSDCIAAGTCTPVRELMVAPDASRFLPASNYDAYNNGFREGGRRERYLDDQLPTGVFVYADVLHSRWDGLAGYRRTETGGNFDAWNFTITDYDPAGGTALLPVPAATSPWVLWMPSLRIVTGEGHRRTMESCYDRSTGLLARERTYSSQSETVPRSANDVVREYVRGARGNVVTVNVYGGDRSPVGTAELCSLTLGIPSSVISNEYTFGALARSYAVVNGAPVRPFIIDQQIDAYTGLAASVMSPSGIATAMEYDPMGRATFVKPAAGHGAWVQNRYVNATGDGASGARHEVIQRRNGSTSDTAVLGYTAVVSDGFGRPWREHRRMPDGSDAFRTFTYDAQGTVISRTEWETTAGTAGVTLYQNIDPFGRPRLVRPADGSHHNVSYQYRGIRSVTETWQAWNGYTTGSAVTEAPRSRSTINDRRSQPYEVVEHSGHLTEPTRVTQYKYDLSGKLMETRADGKLVGWRKVYDGRGFLLESRDDDGSVRSFSEYDAQGNAWRRLAGGYDLKYEFDSLGRLVRISEWVSATLWKEFTYANTNTPGNFASGNLVQAKRWIRMPANYGRVARTEVVTTAFEYGGPEGRLSAKTVWTTRFAMRFRQEYQYDDRGSVTRILYPSCDVCPAGGSRVLTVDQTYGAGLLTGIARSYAGLQASVASLEHHDSGLLSAARFVNGVVETSLEDPSGMRRAARVDVVKSGLAIFPKLLQFQYDGAGTLVRVQKDLYGQISNEYYVARNRQQTSSKFTSSFYSGYDPCAAKQPKADPFGQLPASTPDRNCMPLEEHYPDAFENHVLTEDILNGTSKWTLSGADGDVLTTYEIESRFSVAWIQTVDVVYGDGQPLAKVTATRQATTPQWKYLHSNGTVTDWTGKVTQW